MRREWRSDEERRRDEADAWRINLEAAVLAVAMILPWIAAIVDWLR